MLLAWRNCSAKQVEKINEWLGEPLADIAVPEELQVEELHPTVEDVSEPVEATEPTTLSDDFVKLCKKLASMVKEYDLMAKQMPDGEAKDLLADMSEQIISSMVAGGCKAITKETAFDGHRHKPIPFSAVEDGTPILSTERVGVECDGMVLIQALVNV